MADGAALIRPAKWLELDMSFDQKLDRILSRAEELRFMLSGTLSGEAFVKASKELSELEPIEARIQELRDSEKAKREALECETQLAPVQRVPSTP